MLDIGPIFAHLLYTLLLFLLLDFEFLAELSCYFNICDQYLTRQNMDMSDRIWPNFRIQKSGLSELNLNSKRVHPLLNSDII